MARILVTGSRGFIGSSLCQYLADSEHEVVEFDHKIGLDILDAGALLESSMGCDFIVNLAAQVSVAQSMRTPEATMQVNVEGTRNVIAAAMVNGCKLIHASSAAVYGACTDLPLKEESAGNVLSPYAQSKWENEQDIAHSGLDAVSLRFFNVYGPLQSSDGAYAAVIPKWMELQSQGKMLKVFGDGSQTRDFIHVDDLCSVIEKLLEVDWSGLNHKVYNLASGTAISLIELAEVIGGEVEFDAARDGDIVHSHADITRIEQDLGWRPMVSIRSGIDSLR